jgi:hypothetical protein
LLGEFDEWQNIKAFILYKAFEAKEKATGKLFL